ncbi:MAG: DUF2225 domain-containing protein [Candidatus Sericytochromatia bacterium]|nr:DUF2225 domain-containing protein [Candidatus Sericytochromatia bacterium]
MSSQTRSLATLTSRDVTCPVCVGTFKLYTPRSGTYALLRRDSDNCPHYSGVNPLYYQIWVCPTCGYAALKKDFAQLDDRHHDAVAEALKAAGLVRTVDFRQPDRSPFAALVSFKLAAVTYGARRAQPKVLASMALRAGWICRMTGNLGRELAYLAQASDLLEQAFSLGGTKPGAGGEEEEEEAAIPFLIGELGLRLGRFDQSERWFGLVLQNRETPEKIQKVTRDRLYDLRQIQKVDEVLHHVPLLEPMDDESLGLLAAHTITRKAEIGEVLFRKGEPGDAMFVVTKGYIDIYLGSPEDSKPIARLGPGEAFGEIPLLKGEPRGATAVIAPGSGAELLEVDKPAFRTLVRANPEVVDKLAEMVAERERRNAGQDHPSLAEATPVPRNPAEVQQSIIAAQVRKVLDPMDP